VAESGSAPRFVLAAGRVSAASFLGRGEVAFADAASDTVYLARDLGGADEVLVLAAEREGISRPVAIEAAGRALLVGNAANGAIARIDLETGLTRLIECQCTLTGLGRLRGTAVFHLNQPSREPLMVFDGDAPEARVVFVPPSPPEHRVFQRGKGGAR
jgi:hypothetical protein